MRKVIFICDNEECKMLSVGTIDALPEGWIGSQKEPDKHWHNEECLLEDTGEDIRGEIWMA